MKILYIGDVMGRPGIETLEEVLSDLRSGHEPDLVIAQAENVTEGKGMSVADMQKLQQLGVQFFTGGNHTPKRTELHSYLLDDSSPVIGPANMETCPGKGWKYINLSAGKVLVITLLGSTVGREIESRNPLQEIDQILALNQDVSRIATIVNFHGDYSSEKRIIGYYLDGRVTAVVGDHWHVPTADAMVLPKGTAHITDVGMCGSMHSSLGVTFNSVVPRWRDGLQTRNEMAEGRPYQFNAVLIESDESGTATSIQQLQKLLD